MKLTKRVLLLVLCALLLVMGAVMFVACDDDSTEGGGEGDGGTTACVHEFGEYSQTVAATCTADGTEQSKCSKCGETQSRPIAKLGHEFKTYASDNNATCLADGTKTAKCERCDVTDTVADENTKTPHTFTNYTSNNDATCLADGSKTAKCDTEGCTATETLTDTGSKKAHSFKYYLPDGNATCLADGTKTAVCAYAGCEEKDTVADIGSKKAHSFTKYVSDGNATCVLDGTKTAKCDTDNCNETDTVTDDGSKLGHDWSLDKVTCELGRHCERTGCDAEEAALGHDYRVVGGTSLSCTTDSTVDYACANGCGDAFTVTTERTTGHKVTDWRYVSEDAGADACSIIVHYEGTCESCGNTVTKNESTVRHNLTSTVTTVATCDTVGVKTYKCTNCTHTETRSYDPTDRNDPSYIKGYDPHTWSETSRVTDGNGNTVITYTCSGKDCDETKQTIDCSASTSASVDKELLSGTGEVELDGASIKLDENTLNGLDGKVDISAEKLTEDQKTDLKSKLQNNGASAEELAKLDENTIYDFSMSYTPEGGEKTKVETFNNDGLVTVRVPYNLDGGDADSIAIWFVSDDGTISIVKATYEYDEEEGQGYAVFTTNHFSIYTVTRLSAQERCTTYGHVLKKTTVAATCITDGYTVSVCQRCGHSETTIDEVADGHSITTVTVPATCTEAGSATHSCSDCDYESVEKIAPTGHVWSAGDKLDATCTAAGYAHYSCDNECGATYKAVIPQKAHTYNDTVTPATCTEAGYTTRVCSGCNNTVVTARVPALGHNHKPSEHSATCTEEGYTLHSCTRCDDSYRTDIVPPSHKWDIEAPTCGKGQICTECGTGGLSATGNHTMQNSGVCSVCGAGCKHDFVSAVTAPDCINGGYTTNTCKTCGLVETTDYTSALGHDLEKNILICARCDEMQVSETYFSDMLSALFKEKYSIKLSGLEVEENLFIDMGEIEIGLGEDGKLFGNGYARLVKRTDSGKTLFTASLTALIEDGTVYVQSQNAGSIFGLGGDISAEIPLNSILSFITGSSDAPEIPISDIYAWAVNSLVPFIENLGKDGKAESNKVAAKLIALVADVTYEKGQYVISVNADKIKALNLRLAAEPLKVLIDTELGEGYYDGLITKISELLNKPLGTVIDEAKANGADVIALIDSLDGLVAAIMGAEDATLSDLLEMPPAEDGTPGLQAFIASEEFRSMKLSDALAQLMAMLEGMLGGNTESRPEIGCGGYHYDDNKDGYCDGCGAENCKMCGGKGCEFCIPMQPYCEKCGGKGCEFCEVSENVCGNCGGKGCEFCGMSENVCGNCGGKGCEICEGDKVIGLYSADSSDTVGGEQTPDETPDVAPGEALTQQIVSMLEALGNASVYTLMGAESPESIMSAALETNKRIDEALKDCAITLYTDKSGVIETLDIVHAGTESISLIKDHKVSADNSEIKENVETEITFNPSENYLKGEYETDFEKVAYEFVTDEDGNAIALIVTRTENLAANRYPDVITDENGNETSVYRITYYVDETVYTVDLTAALITTSVKDCGDWRMIMLVGPSCAECSEKQINVVTDMEGNVISEETVNKSMDPESSMFSFGFHYNTKTGEIACGNRTMHKHELDSSSSFKPTGCTDYGENHYFCSGCGDTYVEYYSNGHDVVISAVLNPGSVSCEDGVSVTAACKRCGEKLYEKTADDHVIMREEIEIHSHGACEKHHIYIEKCACGMFHNVRLEGLSESMPDEDFKDEESNRHVMAFCDDCGLVVYEECLSAPGVGCEIIDTRTYTVTLNGSTVAVRAIQSSYMYHDYQTVITLLPGSVKCTDGILVKVQCSDCGTVVMSTVEHDHKMYDKVVADLSDYGSVCGGHLTVWGCACGEMDENHVNVATDCIFEEELIYYDYDSDEYLYKLTCSLTSPMCGFVMYRHHYRVQTLCKTTTYTEYYVLDTSNNKTVLHSTSNENIYHDMQTVEELCTTEATNLPCVYYVHIVRRCSRDGCEHEEIYNGYELIHETRYFEDGNVHYEDYCETCGHGRVRTYSDEGHLMSSIAKYVNVYADGVMIVNEVDTRMLANGYTYTTRYYASREFFGAQSAKVLVSRATEWENREYVYDFSGICSVTITDTDSKGANYTRTECACIIRTETVKESTCTQDGICKDVCEVCGNESESYQSPPNWKHNRQPYGNYHVCVDCGLIFYHDASGEIVLEDASDIDADSDTYIIGYYFPYREFDVLYYVTLILENGEDVYVDCEKYGIEILPFGTGRYIQVSKSAIIAAAADMGYTTDMYDIRISLVPTSGWDGEDYAITFEVMSDDGVCEHFYYEGRCVFCGAEGTDNVCKHEGAYIDGFVEPTCYSSGYEILYCPSCDHVENVNYTGTVECDFVEGYCRYCGTGENVSGVCDHYDEGGDNFCDKCGEYIYSISDCEHNYVDGKCTVCGSDDPDYDKNQNESVGGDTVIGGDVSIGGGDNLAGDVINPVHTYENTITTETDTGAVNVYMHIVLLSDGTAVYNEEIITQGSETSETHEYKGNWSVNTTGEILVNLDSGMTLCFTLDAEGRLVPVQ